VKQKKLSNLIAITENVTKNIFQTNNNHYSSSNNNKANISNNDSSTIRNDIMNNSYTNNKSNKNNDDKRIYKNFWLTKGIIVKIINKRFLNGEYYKQKGN
jgi:hypothetical protein